jgi:hypothetical protein
MPVKSNYEEQKTSEEIIERLRNSYERGEAYLFQEELIVYKLYREGGLEYAREKVKADKELMSRMTNKAKHPNSIAELIAFRELVNLLNLEVQEKGEQDI